MTEACLRIRATSKGVPMIAPKMPLKAEIATFYFVPIVMPCDLSLSTAQV